MNRILLALALTATPTLALAAPVDGRETARLDLAGEVPSACVISTPAAEAGSNTAFQPLAAESAAIRVIDLVDPLTAQARAASINLAFPVTCNGAHRLTVRTERGAMVGSEPAAATPGFRDRLPYRVSAGWAGRTASGASDSGTPVDIPISNGAAGVLSLGVAIDPGGDPLVAGAYSDSLVVELQPAS